ncbi:MAG TPA: phytoene desaturase family protein [Lacibacter sp.]|nr:phytoene desaturase family protein [Lacibacter sp.]
MPDKKAIVIGSGVAGMAAAIRLAIQGFSVDVFERNAYPGGKLSLLEKEGYRFDAGPSLFTQPHNLEQLFAEAGENIADYFQYRQVPLSCSYFFENGKVVNAWTDPQAYEAELVEKLGERPGALQTYLRDSQSLYQSIGTIFLNHSLHRLRTWVQPAIPGALARVKWPYLFGSLHQYNRSRFSTPEAVQIFDRYATYNGSDPYQTPGMMSLIPHLELNEGTFYPEGGMISITHALLALAEKKGVRFHFNSPAERIIEDRGRVRGVVVHQENLPADVVVSNVDVYFTYRQLLQQPQKAAQLLQQERSCSGMIFYWGMKESFPGLHLHNIFFSREYRQEFDSIFRKKQLFPDPTVYVNITSKLEPAHAPEGGENWFVLINAPANTSKDVSDQRQQLRQWVLQKLSRLLQRDVEAAIAVEDYLDPQRIETKTGSYLGALYGTSSNSRMAAFLRHPNHRSSVRGLYFCGGSVHPGGGIPLCFKSAEIVGRLVASGIHH